MSVLTKIEKLMSEGSAQGDVERMRRIKKMLNLKENESIKSVPTTRLVKFAECYGSVAKEGLKRYATLTEDADEKKRIEKVLAMLGVKG